MKLYKGDEETVRFVLHLSYSTLLYMVCNSLIRYDQLRQYYENKYYEKKYYKRKYNEKKYHKRKYNEKKYYENKYYDKKYYERKG